MIKKSVTLYDADKNCLEYLAETLSSKMSTSSQLRFNIYRIVYLFPIVRISRDRIFKFGQLSNFFFILKIYF